MTRPPKQKVGDVCEACRHRWEAKNKEPKVLQKGRKATNRKKLMVPICEYCDGGALKIVRQEA